jgi:ketosteroid isomerase-like protein
MKPSMRHSTAGLGLLVLSLVVVSAVGAAAQSASTPSPQATAEVEATLRRLLDEWADAYVRHDTRALGRILADDLIVTRASPDQETQAKDDYLAKVKADTEKHVSITREDERIRVYGDSAVVTFRARRLTDGNTFRFRITDVFVHRDGRWQLVARHISALPRS